MYLPQLTDRELLTHFIATRDSLTTTDLESAMAERFESLLVAQEEREPIDTALDEHGIDDERLAEILKLLDEHYAFNPSVLAEKLERADKFYDVARDAGDVIHRLQDLITHCQ